MKTERYDNATPELWQSLPNMPGAYLMKASDGTVIYVGKANRLRTRVRSYFREKIRTRLDNADDAVRYRGGLHCHRDRSRGVDFRE